MAGIFDLTALKLVNTAVITSTRLSIMSGIENAEMLKIIEAITAPITLPVIKNGAKSVKGAPCTEGRERATRLRFSSRKSSLQRVKQQMPTVRWNFYRWLSWSGTDWVCVLFLFPKQRHTIQSAKNGPMSI